MIERQVAPFLAIKPARHDFHMFADAPAIRRVMSVTGG
jgi:hypothetical protein